MRSFTILSAQELDETSTLLMLSSDDEVEPHEYALTDTDETKNAQRVRERLAEMVEAGEIVVQPVAVPPEPTIEEIRAAMPVLYPREFRDALIDNGIMPSVITGIISAMPEGVMKEKALNAWENSDYFRRTDPFLLMISADETLNLTDEQVDAMWIAATTKAIAARGV